MTVDDRGRHRRGRALTTALRWRPEWPIASVVAVAWLAQFAGVGMAQMNMGTAQMGGGTAKVGSVLQELAWLSPDSDWDFTLDEIAFYSGTPPAGAVGPNPAGGGVTPDSGTPVADASHE